MAQEWFMDMDSLRCVNEHLKIHKSIIMQDENAEKYKSQIDVLLH